MLTVFCLELNAAIVETCILNLGNMGQDQIIKIEICGQGVLSVANYFCVLIATSYTH